MSKINKIINVLLVSLIACSCSLKWRKVTVDEAVEFVLNNVGKDHIYSIRKTKCILKDFEINFSKLYLKEIGMNKKEAYDHVIENYIFDIPNVKEIGDSYSYEEDLSEYYGNGREFYFDEEYNKEIYENNNIPEELWYTIKDFKQHVINSFSDHESENYYDKQKIFISRDDKKIKREVNVWRFDNDYLLEDCLYIDIFKKYYGDSIYVSLIDADKEIYIIKKENNSYSIAFKTLTEGFAEKIELFIGVDISTNKIDMFNVLNEMEVNSYGKTLLEKCPDYFIGKNINEIELSPRDIDIMVNASITGNAIIEALAYVKKEYNNIKDVDYKNNKYINFDYSYEQTTTTISTIDENLYIINCEQTRNKEIFNNNELMFSYIIKFEYEIAYEK